MNQLGEYSSIKTAPNTFTVTASFRRACQPNWKLALTSVLIRPKRIGISSLYVHTGLMEFL